MVVLWILGILALGAVAGVIWLLVRVSRLEGQRHERLFRLEAELRGLRDWAYQLQNWTEWVYARLRSEAPAPAAVKPEPAEEAEPAAVETGPDVVFTPEAAPSEPELEVFLAPEVVPETLEAGVPTAEPTAPPVPQVPPPAPPETIAAEAPAPPPFEEPVIHLAAARPTAPQPATPMPQAPAPQPVPAPTPAPSGPRPRASFEMTIGTVWLTRIGVVALLAAAVYFLGYLYQQGHIRPVHLFAAAVAAGIALMCSGEFFRRRDYVVQSQALTGGGAALLYLALWAGLRIYNILPTGSAFLAMAIVTAVAALQAIRHQSQTIATFAWITGYSVPLLIGKGAGAASSGPGALFAYLVLLSVAVFVVAQRYAWPVFTGMAVLGAYSSAAYVFDVSEGALGWTLTYLMIVTAGMLWVAATRKGRAGERFGAVGAIAGYVGTSITMLVAGGKSVEAPYMYLLGLSAATLLMSHVLQWRSLRWCGTVGAFVGFVVLFALLKRAGVPQASMFNWLLLYVAMSVGGSLAVSAGRHPDAEPLAISTTIAAYAAAALLAWVAPSGSVSDGAMLAYLGALAAAVLLLTGRFEWRTFSVIGFLAAFLATGLLYERPPAGGLSFYPLMYLVMLGAAALSLTAHLEDRVLGGVAVAAVFAALPLTGLMGRTAPDLVVPAYLAAAAVVSLAVIEWRKWHGFEWFSLSGTWLLYIVWRLSSWRIDPDPAYLAFPSVYLLAFLVASWVRHGLRTAVADASHGVFASANAAAYFGIALWDLGGHPEAVQFRGLLALGLFALYLLAGVPAVWRRPGEAAFGPVLVGIAIVFLTVAVPLLVRDYPCTAAWALEATILLALGFLFRSRALRLGALMVLIPPLFRAIAVDGRIGRETYELLFNSRALSLLAVIAAMYIGAVLYARLRGQVGDGERWLGAALTTGATALLLWIASSEAWCYTGWQLGLPIAAQHFALSGVWVVFGAAFIVLGMARDIAAFRWAAMGLFAATTVKVFSADLSLRSPADIPLLNAHAAPLIAIAALLYAAGVWYARMKSGDELERSAGKATVVAATGLMLWVASSEPWFYLGSRPGLVNPQAAQQMALSMVWLIFAAVMLVLGMARRSAALRWVALSAIAVTGAKALAHDWTLLDPSDYRLLSNTWAFPLVVIVVLLYLASHWYARNAERVGEVEGWLAKAMPVGASVLLWWVLTGEAWHFVGWTLGKPGDPQQYALSAAWTIFGAILIAVGLLSGNAALRWTAIALFAVTVVKVFFFDLHELPTVYRFLALAGLAAVFIGAGLAYQRLVRQQGGQATTER